jgi:hypothetical protein
MRIVFQFGVKGDVWENNRREYNLITRLHIMISPTSVNWCGKHIILQQVRLETRCRHESFSPT